MNSAYQQAHHVAPALCCLLTNIGGGCLAAFQVHSAAKVTELVGGSGRVLAVLDITQDVLGFDIPVSSKHSNARLRQVYGSTQDTCLGC